jgi:ribosome-binding protein aMBF1 (putative translation factor)
MEIISEEKFAQLIKRAITINDTITQQLADNLEINTVILERWADKKDVPGPEIRLSMLQQATNIMLKSLSNIMDKLK